MAVHTSKVNYNVNGVRDRFSNASKWQTDIRSEHAVCEPRERLLCGVCMDCAQAAKMTCVEGLQEVERFRASDLADQDSIGPMTKGCTHQIRDRDGRQRLLLSKRYLPSACFEPKQIRFLEVNLGRLLNHDLFTVQLLDSQEQLRSFQKSNLREYAFVDSSPMPSYRDKLSAEELADLVSYLVSLKGQVNP